MDRTAAERQVQQGFSEHIITALRPEVEAGTLEDGTPVHSFCTLLTELASIVRNTCRTPHSGTDTTTFDVVTSPNPIQRRALELIQQINV